jgi:hypothetical protein
MLAGLLLTACVENPFEEDADVRKWANEGSALAAYASIHDEVALAAGRGSYPDPACPTVDDDGTTLRITGGCTDADGETWNGDATVVRKGGDDVDIEYDGFGKADDDESGTTGTASVREIGDKEFEFEIDLVKKFGIETTIVYSGSVEGYFDETTLWNGSGRVSRDGFLPPTGTVSVATEDQLWDDALCKDAAASGQTRISQNGHHAVITYDGEDDCDDDQAASWTLDGESQGKITGISCAVAPVPTRGAAHLMLSLLILALMRRRR